MFRRRSEADPATEPAHEAAAEQATSTDATSTDATAAGKGRPTPKRREAERHRRTYVQAPKDRKEAARRLRARQKDDRQDRVRAVRGGDESKLPARDAGPVRRLVRDVVDSRRGVANYFLFITLGVLVIQILLSVGTSRGILTTNASSQIQVYLMYAWYLSIIFVAVDAFMMVRKMKALVAERHPDASLRGLSMYAVMRAIQIRRLRLPRAKVSPGDEI